MSRASERNKAVATKWIIEQQLVREGKGTRDWTVDQQRDILERGKAYDDDGVAFEGQHMKSVAAFPEYAGDPDNIQLLSKGEHLEAHGGNWQNPTNWFYNPETKLRIEFGDGPPIPCEIITISNPYSVVSALSTEDTTNQHPDKTEKLDDRTTPEESCNPNPPISAPQKLKNDTPPPTAVKPSKKTFSIKAFRGRFEGKIADIGSGIMSFVTEHPAVMKILGIVATGVAIGVAAAAESHKDSSSGSGHSGSGTNDYTSCSSYTSSSSEKDSSKNDSDSIENDSDYSSDTDSSSERSSPREHEVKGHPQKYHTKDGDIIIIKEPYRRGGNKE